jgi:hypothetical protein
MMAEAKPDLKPANWQAVATTIHCDMVDDAASIMVYKDWTTRCTWYREYKEKAVQDKKRKLDKHIKEKIGKCQGPLCRYVVEYRDKLVKEEFGEKAA